jgi:hypothetical protein
MKTATISIEAYNALIWAAKEFLEGVDADMFTGDAIDGVDNAITEQPTFQDI